MDGLVFLGEPGGEAELLAMGFAFEQATRARKPPKCQRGRGPRWERSRAPAGGSRASQPWVPRTP